MKYVGKGNLLASVLFYIENFVYMDCMWPVFAK